MKRALTANLGWKILSVGIAFVLWAIMGRQSEMAMTISAPVQYRNLADGLDISSDIPERVSLEVRGPADRLTPAYLAGASVELDFGRLPSPGEQTFNIDARNTKLPIGISLARAVPSQIRINFERSVTREVPVHPRFSGAVAGYHVAACVLRPQAIRVRGPESHVQPLELLQTDPIDLTGVIGRRAGRVHAYVGDPQVRVEGPGSIDYILTMQRGGR